MTAKSVFQHGHLKIPMAILHSNLTPGAKMIYSCFASIQAQLEVPFVRMSYNQIARILGTAKKSSVADQLKELHKAGYLVINGSGRNKTYCVTAKPLSHYARRIPESDPKLIEINRRVLA